MIVLGTTTNKGTFMENRKFDGPVRMTQQRKIIMEALKESTSHPSADEVYEIVRCKLPHISLATVYRNLVLLNEAGLVSKVEYGGKPKRFDGCVTTHYHVRCLSCGKIDDLKAELAVDIRPAMRELSSYEITGHKLDLFGYCPACKAKRNKSMRLNRRG
jgi:Fur family transcriptional regulator, ferric uptake regulator